MNARTALPLGRVVHGHGALAAPRPSSNAVARPAPAGSVPCSTIVPAVAPPPRLVSRTSSVVPVPGSSSSIPPAARTEGIRVEPGGGVTAISAGNVAGVDGESPLPSTVSAHCTTRPGPPGASRMACTLAGLTT